MTRDSFAGYNLWSLQEIEYLFSDRGFASVSVFSREGIPVTPCCVGVSVPSPASADSRCVIEARGAADLAAELASRKRHARKHMMGHGTRHTHVRHTHAELARI